MSKSEISWKTFPELRLRPGENHGPQWWHYRDDTGTLRKLDDTHTLITDYGDDEDPAASVELQLWNDTAQPIVVQVTAQGDSVVTPTGSHTVGALGGMFKWTCTRKAGQRCECSTPKVQCRCASWSITNGTTIEGIPDPTFKVRWQALGDD